MSEFFQGTKGPWEVKYEACDQTVCIDIIGDGVCVFSATPWSDDTECDINKVVANGNLIAASPEMFEALRQLRNFVQDCYHKDNKYWEEEEHPMNLARKALSKALGS